MKSGDSLENLYMDKVKKIAKIVGIGAVSVGLILGFAYLSYLVASQIQQWIASLDIVIQAALIAVGGAVLTAITALTVKRLENKHAVDAQFRKDKAELFLEFMRAFDDLFSTDKTKKIKRGDNLLNLLMDFRRKTIVWCRVETIHRFDELKDFAAASTSSGKDQTVEWMAKNLELYGQLLLAMRKDVGLSRRGLDDGTFGLRFRLRNPDLLLQAVSENPNMSLDELAEREKSIGS